FPGDPALAWAGSGLNRTLLAGQDSLAASVLSDSTADGITDWWYLWATLVAGRHPAYTVRWVPWSDANQDQGAPVVIQAGPLGDRYLTFTASTAFNWQLPAPAGAGPVDLDVSRRVALDDWTPATQNVLCARWPGINGQNSWWFDVETNGVLELIWSPDGTTSNTAQSTVAPTVVDGAKLWVRAQLDVDNGAGAYTVNFFTSPPTDGATWTQLGATVTGLLTTTLFDPGSTIAYTIGSRGTSGSPMSGKSYETRIRSGLNGGVILPELDELWQPFSTGSNNLAGPSGSPILTFFASAQSGQGLAYLSDATRLPKLLPLCGTRMVVLATSHNDGFSMNGLPSYTDLLLSEWAAWITAVKARAPEAAVVVATENPETAGTTPNPDLRIRACRIRREMLLPFAAQQAAPALDAWQAFLDSSGNVVTSFIAADGVHPTATGPGDGMHLWASYADNALGNP
ncbi:MAG TPA: hypothetical protein VIJ60_10470, partial [Acidimicrobiales bacterium]